jgi:hypothetical protein
VTDDVDHPSRAYQAVRHGLVVGVDVAVHQHPWLQLCDHFVQALEAVVRRVLTVTAVPRRGVGQQDVDATAVASVQLACCSASDH